VLALLSGLGIKDIFYGVLITAALSWGGWTYHKYESAVKYAANAKAETAQVQAKAAADIKAKDDDYAAQLAASKVTQDAQIKAAAAQSADLAQRLRDYQARRCPNPVLPGTASASAGGTPSASSVDEAVAGIIAAAAHDHAVIVSERAERDALTGK
jgi:hypothetical protein